MRLLAGWLAGWKTIGPGRFDASVKIPILITIFTTLHPYF
jgi:hypothetical protein